MERKRNHVCVSFQLSCKMREFFKVSVSMSVRVYVCVNVHRLNRICHSNIKESDRLKSERKDKEDFRIMYYKELQKNACTDLSDAQFPLE